MIELVANDVVLVPTAWWKQPANLYLTMVPAGVMPALDDHRGLVDPRAWHRAWSSVISSGTGNSIASYAPSDGGWEVPTWAIETDAPRSVIRPEKNDTVRLAARLWLRHLDPAWRSAQAPHPDVSVELVLEWLDRIVDALEDEPAAAVAFHPVSFLGLMVAEVGGHATPLREVWWQGHDHLSTYW